jgi:hypothetical protein
VHIKQGPTHMSRPLLQLVGVTLPTPCCTRAPVYVRRARPQDSASLHPSPHLGNVAPSFFMVNAVFASGIVLRTFRFADSIAWYGRKGCCPSDLPLRSIPPTALRLWAPPAYGRGWPGSAGQHHLRPCNFNPFLLRCAEGHGNRPWRLALVALSVVSSHPR